MKNTLQSMLRTEMQKEKGWKMNIVQCTKGHFYDSEKYSFCPQCVTNTSKGDYRKNSKNNSTGKISGVSIKTSISQYEENGITHSKNAQEKVTEKPKIKTDPTVVMGGTGKFLFNTETEFVKKETTTDTNTSTQQVSEQPLQKNSSVNKVGDQPQKTEKHSSSAQDKENGIRRGIAGQKHNGKPETDSMTDDNKTVGFFGVMPPQYNMKSAEQVFEPPVGWIVCVRGSSLHQSYPLYAGNNSIGRDSGNRVCIAGDMKISRSRHAIITYEPKRRFFVISPGDGSGLTYLNKKLITGAHKLKHHDFFEIGQSSFIFIPLCDKSFSWDDFHRR